jgi:hydroxymethylpyrimidine/phosphomethylpyrimidine kinase
MSDDDEVLGNLVRAVKLLEESPDFAKLIPEIKTNIAYALPSAKDASQVAGIKGRITVIDGKPRATGYPAFGASSHLARMILTLMKVDPSKRAVMDIAYSEELEWFLEDYCSLNSLVLTRVNRHQEPLDIAHKEGSSMQWVAEEMVKKASGSVPDINCTVGGEGKEPVIVIFGKSALDVALTVIGILEFTKQDKKPQKDEDGFEFSENKPANAVKKPIRHEKGEIKTPPEDWG